jgi:hypothetical protein
VLLLLSQVKEQLHLIIREGLSKLSTSYVVDFPTRPSALQMHILIFWNVLACIIASCPSLFRLASELRLYTTSTESGVIRATNG